MKQWLFSMGLALVAVGALLAPAHGEGRYHVLLENLDFPPERGNQHPISPARKTQFLQALDAAMAQTDNLSLTPGLEEADYRVELKCGGVVYCSKLKVNILTLDRELLATYVLPGRPIIGTLKIEQSAQALTTSLQKHLEDIQRGGVGVFSE